MNWYTGYLLKVKKDTSIISKKGDLTYQIPR
ncbi:unnamed protein product [Spirodela intermedia]|uniref:Uncharacterized protein n=1 Tax=Spirodela intermedia TaxID=51605 RepID=A0A7I8J6I7_SPIIN|nr:unnamed protein product [Spirodela intermedia]CAA6665721.1 unnamed protein product [Spirodela intermedia]